MKTAPQHKTPDEIGDGVVRSCIIMVLFCAPFGLIFGINQWWIANVKGDEIVEYLAGYTILAGVIGIFLGGMVYSIFLMFHTIWCWSWKAGENHEPALQKVREESVIMLAHFDDLEDIVDENEYHETVAKLRESFDRMCFHL